MSQVYIVSGCRTPIGSFNGQFEKHPASDLGAVCITEALKRANLEPTDVEQVIMGHVLQAGQGQNPARQSSAGAKIPFTTSTAYTINMLCGSGLKAVQLAYQGIRNQDLSIVVAGGQEVMTRAQHSTYARNAKLGDLNLTDTLLKDGLTDAFHNAHMGNTTEHLAKKYNISREAQDKFAVESQARTQNAIKNGWFKAEIVPVTDARKGLIENDEYPKANVTFESLSKLKACFEATGSVTPGNASGVNDGAAAVVVVGEDIVKQKGLKPLARIIGFAESGCEPMCMGIGPIDAVNKLLAKVGWSREEVDLYELNEAFAAQSIICLDQLKLDASKVNISGGAISLGHPIGCSGTRVLVTLIYNLRRLGKTKGVCALCVGGGMGIAAAIEIV